MKKFNKILVLLLFMAIHSMFSPVSAYESQKIAVFPVNIPIPGSSFSIYPQSVSLIAGDITNELAKDQNIMVIDVPTAERKILNAELQKDFLKLVKDYKKRYILNTDKLKEIANTIGANKIMFVSGGFDTQQMLIKHNLSFRLSELFMRPSVIPAYRLNVIVSIFDPKNGVKFWEKSYDEYFRVSDFGSPSQYFAENSIPIEQIKKFSDKLSKKVTKTTKKEMHKYNVNAVYTTEQVNENTDIATTDGLMTKDGHFIPTPPSLINEKKRQEYIDWAKDNMLID